MRRQRRDATARAVGASMLLAGALAMAQPATGPSGGAAQPAATRPQPLAERFAARLASLSPSEPEAYLLLGEEVLDAAGGPADTRLAVDLFGRAFELARGRPGDRHIAASACHGLAEATGVQRDRRWYEALAALVDPTGAASPAWLRRPPPASVDAMPFRLAVVLGHVRAGEGVIARQTLARPEVMQALRAIEPLLRRGGVQGGISWLEREAAAWPCRECANKGVVKRGGGPQPEHRACPVCAGTPGPAMQPAELMAQVRLESWLLQGEQRSWAAQLAVDDGTPLADPDPAAVCTRAGVDAARMYWRHGRWVRHPDGRDDDPPQPARQAEGAKPSPTVPLDPTGGVKGD